MFHCVAPGKRSRLTLALFAIILAVLVFDAYIFASFGGVPAGAYYLLGAVIAIALWAAYAMWSMRFEASPDGISAYFFPFTYRIPAKEISSIQCGEKVEWWRGLGVRLGWGSLWFVSAHSKTVKIEKRSGFFRTILFTPEHPEKFAECAQRALHISRARS
ncbi:hypothetical protein AUJ14_03425 [Candidatus Micrarchaeota archaeon CG1_02_55_22]|nr:MAG: hypothetical protein AUJ14_03425 [Candidatus Micrarchaeota archaeon CG1_02_55_22]